MRKRDLPDNLTAHDLAYLHITDQPTRLPTPEHRLIQLGYMAPADRQPGEIIRAACDSLSLPAPVASSALF